jgi:hypothetical protein
MKQQTNNPQSTTAQALTSFPENPQLYEMYVTCINTMVSGEIGYSASRPDNSKEMYPLADLFKICIISQ